MIRFRDLKIGDTFDFIRPEPARTVFNEPCKKVSARKYVYSNNLTPEGRYLAQVGTINVEVFHVNEYSPETLERPFVQ